MDENAVIGNSVVRICNAEFLPGTLAGLRRLSCEERGPVDVTIEVETRAVRDWPLGVTVRDDAHCFGGPSYVLKVEPSKRRMRLLLAAGPHGDELYWFQRDFFGVLACVAGDLMLHGCAVAAPDGGAWVFCGASGVGKSTLCRMLVSEGLAAINDEVNWLYYHSDHTLHIVSQPFWFGEMERPSLPVTRLHLLRQGGHCALHPPLAKSETFARLLAAYVSIDTPYDFLKARASVLIRLIEERTIEVLEFNRDANELRGLLWTNMPPNDC